MYENISFLLLNGIFRINTTYICTYEPRFADPRCLCRADDHLLQGARCRGAGADSFASPHFLALKFLCLLSVLVSGEGVCAAWRLERGLAFPAGVSPSVAAIHVVDQRREMDSRW